MIYDVLCYFFQADLTGLMYASFHNHPDVASALIEAGCELNSVGTVSTSFVEPVLKICTIDLPGFVFETDNFLIWGYLDCTDVHVWGCLWPNG
jgi:ankyrin repeat protein